MVNSIFSIKDKDNNFLGTTFCIYKDNKKSYFVTCAHVVENKKSIYINSKIATIEAKGSKETIDLSVLSIDRDENIKPFKLSKEYPLDNITIKGFSYFNNNRLILKELDCYLLDIPKLYFNNNQIDLLEVEIYNNSIKKGYSGSPLIKDNIASAIVTDRYDNNIAYCIPIKYIKKVWKSMPNDIFIANKFTSKIIENNHPTILYYTDMYNYNFYLNQVTKEAINQYTKEYFLDINCGRYFRIDNIDDFYKRLSKQLFNKELNDDFDFWDDIKDKINLISPNRLFILIRGLDRLQKYIFDNFVSNIRALIDEGNNNFNLTIFGGRRVVELKYNNSDHSLFNIFNIEAIPEPTYLDYKQEFKELKAKEYNAIIQITGNHSKLTLYCIKKGCKTDDDTKEAILKSTLKTDLFIKYKKDDILPYLKQEYFNNAHEYSSDNILRELFWDNLLIIKNGKFFWRSEFIAQMGREYFKG